MIAEGEVNQLTAQRRIETGRRPVSRDHRRQDRRAVRRRLPHLRAWSPSGREAEELALDAYGRNLGIAFQLVDDAIDYVSDGATMGKDTGDDFRDGKVTLPVILAYARGVGGGPQVLEGRDERPGTARRRICRMRRRCCARAGALDDRSPAPAITASAPSTRSAGSPMARPRAR